MKKLTIVMTLFVIVFQVCSQRFNTIQSVSANESAQDFNNNSSGPGKPFNHLVNPADIGNPPSVNWIEQFGGDGPDVGQKVISDANGNIFMTGYFSGPVSFGTSTFTSVGYFDAFVARFSSSGSLIWLKQLSCQQYEIAKGFGITLDNTGNVYITGYFNGVSLKVGSNTLFKSGNEDLFIAKYDQDGNVLMANHRGFAGVDMQGKNIAVDAAGNSFVINGSHSTLTTGCYNLTRFNSSGQIQWDYSNGALFTDLKIYNEMIFVTGYLTSTVLFGNTPLTATVTKSAPFIAQCDTSGIFSWAVQGVTTTSSVAYNRSLSLALDDNGDIYIAGRFKRTLTFGSLVLNNIRPSYAPFLLKCTAGGSFVWAKQANVVYSISSSNYSRTVAIASNGTGNISMTCELANDTIDFNGYEAGGTGSCLIEFDVNGTAQWIIPKTAILNDVFATPGNKLLTTGQQDGNVVALQYDGFANPELTIRSVGNSGMAQVINLETNSTGELYVYGTTVVQTAMFGSTSGTFLAKMQPDGEVAWSLPFMGGNIQTGYGDYLSVDPDGNIGVMGFFYDTLKIGNKTLINTVDEAAVFIVKINPAGEAQWIKQVGTGSISTGYSLTADRAGNFIACGTFWDQITIGSHNLVSTAYDDVFLAKLDGNGNVLWAQRAGGEDMEWEAFASTDSLNNIYLTGEFVSRNITFNEYPLTLTEFDGDVVLSKYSPDGIIQWAYAYGGDPVSGGYERYSCWPTAIKTNAAGDSYLYGWTGSRNNYGPFLLESQFSYNFFVTKINKSGTVQWAKIIKEKKYGYHSMQCDLDKMGNFYLGGNFYDTLYFNNQVVLPQGERDLFFAKFDLDGNIGWVKFFNSNPLARSAWYNPVNYLYAITAYDSESVFIGGISTYDMQFGTGIVHSSNQNGYVALLGQDIQYGIAPSPEHSSGLSVFPNPATDMIFIDASGVGPGRITINILNVNGQSVHKVVLEANPQVIPIDLPGISPGVYLVKLENTGYSVAAKLVVH